MLLVPAYNLEVILDATDAVYIQAIEVLKHVFDNAGMDQEEQDNQSRHCFSMDFLLSLRYLLIRVPEAEAAECKDKGEEGVHYHFLKEQSYPSR